MTAVLEEHPDTHRFYFVDPNFFGPVGRGRSRALNLAQLIRERFLLRPTPAYRAALAAGRLVVSAHNPYEGTVPYLHPEVAFLAETMAEVCRHVFSGLSLEVWVGDDTGGAGHNSGSAGGDHTAAAHRLAGLNRSLVGLFEHLLDGLDGGGLRPSAELAADVVGEARAWVAQAV